MKRRRVPRAHGAAALRDEREHARAERRQHHPRGGAVRGEAAGRIRVGVCREDGDIELGPLLIRDVGLRRGGRSRDAARRGLLQRAALLGDLLRLALRALLRLLHLALRERRQTAHTGDGGGRRQRVEVAHVGGIDADEAVTQRRIRVAHARADHVEGHARDRPVVGVAARVVHGPQADGGAGGRSARDGRVCGRRQRDACAHGLQREHIGGLVELIRETPVRLEGFADIDRRRRRQRGRRERRQGRRRGRRRGRRLADGAAIAEECIGDAVRLLAPTRAARKHGGRLGRRRVRDRHARRARRDVDCARRLLDQPQVVLE